MRVGEEVRFRSLPVRLGTPLRAPHFAWPRWGITHSTSEEFQRLVQLSEEAYCIEWQRTTSVRHDEIGKAARIAGLADANRRLNDCVADVAVRLIERNEAAPFRILDLGAGAGATTMATWKRLTAATRQRTSWTLMDPAAHALDEARETLRHEGIGNDQLTLDPRRDLDGLPRYQESFDLAVSTAAIHHHACVEPVCLAIAEALKVGGFFVNGDWHNLLSTHPAFILSLLEQLDWPEKAYDLDLFRRAYPAAAEAPHNDVMPRQERATREIMRFWVAYAQCRRPDSESFLVIEGHRPVDYYVQALRGAGLDMPLSLPYSERSNPCLLRPESELLAVLAARKPPPGA